jgi:hypothetical protein
MDFICHSNIRKSEKGIFLPLAAVVALGLFAFLFLLVGYTSRVKLAQSELRAKLDIACGNSAQEVGYQGKIDTFALRVKEFNTGNSLRYSTLEKVRLIVPTMPETRDLPFDFLSSQNPVGGNNPMPLVADCPAGTTCEVYRTVNYPGANYPPGFWSIRRNGGNTIACEVEARVKTDFISPYFLSKLGADDSLLKLKSVWWTPIRASSTGPGAVNTAPGLTIAVGTELFTTNWDKRFRFKSAPSPFPSQYDPMMTTGIFSSAQPRTKADDPALTGSETAWIPKIATSDLLFPSLTLWGNRARSPAKGNKFSDTFSFDTAYDKAGLGQFPEVPSDRDGLLTACMNPLILVRNTFLSTIVELAARHGQLRNMTEILHINPMHRDDALFPSSAVYNANFPTKIVSFGQDLMQPEYQLPYIFYNTGRDDHEIPDLKYSATDVPDLYTEAYSYYNWFNTVNPNLRQTNLAGSNLTGWLNPFQRNGVGVGSAPSTWEENTNNPELHALVASQLRYCYNMYGAPPTGGGVTGLERNSELQEVISPDSRYDPEIFQDEKQQSSDQWVLPRKGRDINNRHWDQECQFANCPGKPMSDENLNAAELVSILGSTQLCPYGYPYGAAANAFIPGSTANPCPLTYPPSYSGINLPPPWPASGSTSESVELSPDLVGMFNYINHDTNPDKGWAINSPGIFPLKPSVAPDDVMPFSLPKYTRTENKNSAILIVIHKPPVLKPIYTMIHDIISSMTITSQTDPTLPNQPVRPITVIYLPSNYEDSRRASDLSNIAFIAQSSSNEVYYSTASGNAQPIAVYNFSPYDKVWGPRCGGPGDKPGVDSMGNYVPVGAGTPKTQSEVFQDYWDCLLRGDTFNIVNEATTVFNDRLIRKELKY